MIGLHLKFLLVLTLFAFILLFMIPFQYQFIDGSLTSSTNKSNDSNATASLTSSSSKSNNQTKYQSPNSTMAITKSLQNSSRQGSAFSSSAPVQNTSNVVISRSDQEEQQLLSSPPTTQQQLSGGMQQPLLPTLPQPIQQFQLSSLPTYPQASSVIQSELLIPSALSAPEYPQTPSLIQLLQNFPSLTSTYPEAHSLIQSQQLLQSIPLEPILQPLYSYPVNTLTTFLVLQPEIIESIEIPPRILSHSSYVDSTGNLRIVGEVINESHLSIRFVEIIATFYDANNSVIGTDFTFTSPSTIQPGQRAPFDIFVSEGSFPTYLMAYYILSVDYSDF